MRWQTARWMRPQKVGDVLPHFLAHGAPLHIIPAGKGAPSKRKPILHLHSMGTGCILWMKLICSRCVETTLCVVSQEGAGPFSANAVIWGPYRFGGHAAASDQAPFCAHARLCRKMRKIRPACKSGIPGVWHIGTCVTSKRTRVSIQPWEWSHICRN